MREFKFLFLILILLGCKTESKKAKSFTASDWKNILTYTLAFAEGEKPYVFKNYENDKSKDLISSIYKDRSEKIGYQFHDSVYYYLRKRTNGPILDRLDTMFNITFVQDTIMLNKNVIIFSEPFFINDSIICISMSNIIMPKATLKKKVFFLKKSYNSYGIIEVYDVNKDKFYRPVLSI